MNFDQEALAAAQRRAFLALASSKMKDGSANPNFVDPKLCTSPAMLIQELAWINTTQSFDFDFSLTAPAQIPGTNNNRVIKKNDVFAVYGVQILQGTGTNSASFIYRSHGVLPTDDAIYNSTVSLKVESSTYVDKMEGQFFRHNPNNSNEYFGEMGMQLINPIRIIKGETGTFTVSITLNSPSAALVISANTVISMRLHGVYGQRKG